MVDVEKLPACGFTSRRAFCCPLPSFWHLNPLTEGPGWVGGGDAVPFVSSRAWFLLGIVFQQIQLRGQSAQPTFWLTLCVSPEDSCSQGQILHRAKALQPFTPLDLLSAGSGCSSKFLKTLGSDFKALLIFLIILALLGVSSLAAQFLFPPLYINLQMLLAWVSGINSQSSWSYFN